MKHFILSLMTIILLTACTVESSSNPASDEIQKSVLETFVAETVQAVHISLGTTTVNTEQVAPATVTMIPVMTATQPVATLTAVPTMAPAVVPTQPKVAPAVPLPANTWQLLSNIPKTADPGTNMYVKVKTSPNQTCELIYTCPGWSCSDSFDYQKNADENGFCEWTWQIMPDSASEVAGVTIDVGGSSQSYEIWVNGPTPTE